MRAGLYLRQSMDVQEGIDRQRDRTQKLADARDYEVVEIFEDNDVSASKSRKGKDWERMLNAAREKRIDVVICVDLDRLLRSTADLIPLIETGAKVLTVDGEIDLTTADGEFRATMLAALARFEVKRKSERQLRANADRHAKELPVSGKRRYGYQPANRSTGLVGNSKILEEEARIVRFIYAATLRGVSIREIARTLNRHSVPFHGKVTEWGARRVRGILVNPAYRGAIVSKGGWTDTPNVDTLIDPDRWKNVQAVLTAPGRKRSPGPEPRHLLTGLANCGTCQQKMRHTGKMYYCRTPIQGHPAISDAVFEGLVVDEIIGAFLWGPKAILATQADIQDPAPIYAEINALNERMVGLTSAFVNTRSPSSTAILEKSVQEIDARKIDLETRLEEIKVQQGARWVLASIAGNMYERSANGKVSLLSGNGESQKKVRMRRAFEELGLDAKRDLVAGLLEITLYPGRNNRERTVIRHKVAFGQNADRDPIPTAEEIEDEERRYEEYMAEQSTEGVASVPPSG